MILIKQHSCFEIKHSKAQNSWKSGWVGFLCYYYIIIIEESGFWGIIWKGKKLVGFVVERESLGNQRQRRKWKRKRLFSDLAACAAVLFSLSKQIIIMPFHFILLIFPCNKIKWWWCERLFFCWFVSRDSFAVATFLVLDLLLHFLFYFGFEFGKCTNIV